MEFDQAVAELETLVATLEREGDQRALFLLELVDAIHRPALKRILAGEVSHPVAQAVLAMYDLAALDDRLRVEEALDQVRPYIGSHGGRVDVLEVDGGTVHVMLSGACHGCAGSALTLRRGIEQALREHYPGFSEVVAHEPAPPPGSEGLRRPVFEAAGTLGELAPGTMRVLERRGESIVIVNLAGEPYAFRNACPLEAGRRLPLDGGRLAGHVLVCPWHNCAYDVRSGRRVDDRPDGPGLAVVPVAVRDGVLAVAVSVG